MSISFDFKKWIKDETEQRRRGDATHPGGYAYTADEKVRRVLAALGPVKLATEATVRLWNTTARADLLGSAVRVGPNLRLDAGGNAVGGSGADSVPGKPLDRAARCGGKCF